MAFKSLKDKLMRSAAILAGVVGLSSAYNQAKAQSVFFDIIQHDGLTALAPNTTYTFDIVAKTDGQPSSGVSLMDFNLNVNNNLDYGFTVDNTKISGLSKDFFSGYTMSESDSASYNAGQVHVSRSVEDPSMGVPNPSNYQVVASFDFNTGNAHRGDFTLDIDSSSAYVFDKDSFDFNHNFNAVSFDSYSGAVVPETSTYALGAGLAALGAAAALRSRKKRN